MKSIISSGLITAVIVACLTVNVQAKSVNHLATSVTAVSDTGKMAKMKKMKMKKDSVKKMAKDTMKKKVSKM